MAQTFFCCVLCFWISFLCSFFLSFFWESLHFSMMWVFTTFLSFELFLKNKYEREKLILVERRREVQHIFRAKFDLTFLGYVRLDFFLSCETLLLLPWQVSVVRCEKSFFIIIIIGNIIMKVVVETIYQTPSLLHPWVYMVKFFRKFSSTRAENVTAKYISLLSLSRVQFHFSLFIADDVESFKKSDVVSCWRGHFIFFLRKRWGKI